MVEAFQNGLFYIILPPEYLEDAGSIIHIHVVFVKGIVPHTWEKFQSFHRHIFGDYAAYVTKITF